MADISPTAANVQVTSTSTTSRAVAGAGVTITQGQAFYIDSGLNTAALADCTAVGTSSVAGIAVTPAAATESFMYVSAGSMDLGVTLTVGETYVLSTAGGISPIGDLTTNDFVSVIGTADATDNIVVRIDNTGVQKP